MAIHRNGAVTLFTEMIPACETFSAGGNGTGATLRRIRAQARSVLFISQSGRFIKVALSEKQKVQLV